MSATPDPPRDIAGLAVVGAVARAVAPPVAILLLTGLAAATSSPLAIDAESAAHVTTVPLRELASPGILLTPLGVLTVAFVL